LQQIGVPGAFTTPCNAHIPGYIENYDKFKAKGVNEIYVFAVNDNFVTKYVLRILVFSSTTNLTLSRAWKEKLAPEGTRAPFALMS